LITKVATTPFKDQKPGTSGLRKAVAVYRQPRYIENFVQAILDVADLRGRTLVVGGDGRFLNDHAIQIILRMAAAAGVARIVVGRNGILSTPAVSAVIRDRKAGGGIVLSASHNPGGPEGDFGIKYNVANGGPAPESVTQAIYERTLSIESYSLVEAPDLDLDRLGETTLGETVVEIVDPVETYAALMETLFDFDRLRAMVAGGFRMRFDAMSAVTGPYGRAIFERRLGATEGTVLNGEPLPDFGGHHPDPNPVHAAELIAALSGPGRAAIRRGLGRRRGPQPHRRQRLRGVALRQPRRSRRQRPPRSGLCGRARGRRPLHAHEPRSRPGGGAARHPLLRNPDGLEIFRQPAGRGPHHPVRRGERRHGLEPCAREGRHLGRPHVAHHPGGARRERRRHPARTLGGLWARLLPAPRLRRGAHRGGRGRDERPSRGVAGLVGRKAGGLTVASADEFAYTDPVDGSVSRRQGIRVFFEEGARAVFRLSGTGTSGATIRVYLERYEPDPARQDLDPNEALAEVAAAAREIADLQGKTGYAEPTLIA
jgi:phosphoglucomutase